MKSFTAACQKIAKDSVGLFWIMVKTMVPVMILVRILMELGLVDYLGVALEPLMGLMGLPAATGLVLAVGLLVSTYSAVAVMLTILPLVSLSVADVTVLLSVVLIAHALPLEQSISRRAGISFVFSSSLRFVVGITYGMVLNLFYSAGGWLQQSIQLDWLPFAPTIEETWLQWGYSSASLLFTMFWIIMGLIIFLKLLELMKITDLIGWLLSPLLRLMGISKAATPITMVGVLLGLSYGGGLIIKEAQEGKLSSRDVVLSLSFMGICHGLIEDPLVMMAFGAHWSGALVGRFVFCVAAMALIGRLIQMMPEDAFNRFLYRPAKTAKAVG
ncbi:nucleoside recognition protein [Pseudovibrio sp. POLY-S9]|uniref:nucleoside recognition protein n=1 Tax=Pseudovibrio sp. POLY-S9 TaxID=1576596 RepID=UPI001AD94533|nr:nucleoside recognition protein [Pseudovibrio sp. POLY-S9]